MANLVTKGALVSYGASNYEIGRLSAKYLQRVLTGTSPQNLPVESLSRVELVVNLKTAREIGLTIPQACGCVRTNSLSDRSDRIARVMALVLVIDLNDHFRAARMSAQGRSRPPGPQR